MAATRVTRAGLSGPVTWPRSVSVQISYLVLGSLGALVVALGLVVVWRRLWGGLSIPPPWPAGLLSGALAAGVAAAWRSAGAGETRCLAPRRIGLLRRWLPSLLPLIWGLAMSLPPASAAALVGFWSLVVVEEMWGLGLAGSGWDMARRGWGGRGSARRVHLGGNRRLQTTQLPAAVHAPSAPPGMPEAAAEGEVIEQLTRCRLADGREQIAGWLAVRFAPGQRTDCLHVAFCPPFARSPELQITQLDGPCVRIKTGQLQPYGVRLDLKLAEPASAAERVVLSFAARAPA